MVANINSTNYKSIMKKEDYYKGLELLSSIVVLFGVIALTICIIVSALVNL